MYVFLFLTVRYLDENLCTARDTHVLLCLPDTCLGEPRLIPDGRHSCVHEGVGLDELQGVVRELDGALKGRSWTMTCTAPGSRMKGAQTHTGQKVKDRILYEHTPESNNNVH